MNKLLAKLGNNVYYLSIINSNSFCATVIKNSFGKNIQNLLCKLNVVSLSFQPKTCTLFSSKRLSFRYFSRF